MHVAMLVGCLVGPGKHGVLVGDIEDGRSDLDVQPFTQADSLGQTYFIDIAERQVCAPTGEFFGQGSTNP